MGVYIKGMEMPTSCRACLYSRTDIRNVDWCVLTEKDLPCDCPLVPVPPHGRLIDADALRAEQQEDADLFQGSTAYGDKCRRDEAMNAVANIVNAPTIIEAEEASDGED